MILVDTSVWVDHLRRGERHLSLVLEEGKVLIHPWIVGEIACGYLRNRAEILRLLRALPRIESATDFEVFSLIERRKLYGRGLGWADMHLLASAIVSNTSLWTFDKRLNEAAHRLHVSYA